MAPERTGARSRPQQTSSQAKSVDSRTWAEVQQAIWDCTACRERPRVELALRQQTPAPGATKLLVVAIAPPFKEGVSARTRALSVHNNPADKLRRFLEGALQSTWEDLAGNGLTVLHAVKCAIRPKDGFQNPPTDVIDACVPRHLAKEFSEIRPAVVITLGHAPYRAVLKMPGCDARGLMLSRLPARAGSEATEHTLRFGVQPFVLIASDFPRLPKAQQVARDIRRAAVRAGLAVRSDL